jgi:hypothetical protein
LVRTPKETEFKQEVEQVTGIKHELLFCALKGKGFKQVTGIEQELS